jgi:hypothetical protein
MKTLYTAWLVALLGLISPISAHASYFLAAFGTSEVDEEGFKDDTATRFGVGFGGSEQYQFEFSYLNLGEFEATDAALAEISSITGVNVTNTTVEITGIDLSVLSSIPLNDAVSMRGRIGVYMWDTEFTVSIAGFGDEGFSDDGNDVGFGFGLDIALGESAGLTFMYDQYEAFDADIQLLNAGIKVDF